MTGFRTLDDIGDVTGKRVLVRVDLNVPMFEGAVSDATRIQAAMPTIRELSDKGAIVLLLAHFGRPKGAKNPTQSLSLVMRSEEHTSELQSLMRISYAVFCLKNKHVPKILIV